ncbi:hypothetical protein AYO46_05740, partial [Betaproteobacteria bacterium SCGC AG-212-J23]
MQWMWVQPAWAGPSEPTSNLPTGGQWAKNADGTAGGTITTPSATQMQMNQAQRSGVVDFNCFCSRSGTLVNLTAPTTDSTTLIRSVEGANLWGRFTANDNVFISSAAGVYISRTASVEVGSLFATSLSISNADFFAGRYNFSKNGSAGAVVNDGQISIIHAGGYAALAGPQVQNNGIIVASAGTVSLAAGDRVTLDMIGDGLVKVSVDAAALNALALNSGTIAADGGRVILTARSANALLDTVINNTGVIRATTLAERGGEIVLDGGDRGIVANSGTLTATGLNAGEKGGSVQVLGQYVALNNGTRIDASGDAGGGNVNIGGNFQGQGPLQNAAQTIVAKDVSIKADAVTDGDGGNVVVWSNDATQFYGSISAQGGSNSGNGGNVEVSGKHGLNFQGTVNTLAPHGHAGTLLLDPDDLTIVHDDAVATDVNQGGAPNFVETPTTGNPWQLLDTTISTALNGADVTITTSSGSIAIQNTSGTVVLAGSNAHSLTMTSAGDISWNAGWQYNNDSGLLTLSAANGQISGTGAIAFGGTINSLAMLAGTGVNVSTTGLTNVAASTDTGGISISNSGTGDVVIDNLGVVNGLQVFTSGSVSVTNSAGAITVSGDITSQGDLTLNASGALSNSGAQTITVPFQATLTGSSIDIGNQASDSFTSQSLTYNSAGAVSIAQDAATQVAGTNTANSLTLTSTGAISTFAAGTSQTIGNDASFSGTSITLADNATDALSVGGNASFTASGGGVSIGAAGAVNSGSITFNATGAVSITEASAMKLKDTSTADSLTLTSTAAITDVSGTSLTVTNDASFSGTAITLANNAADTLSVGGNASFTATSGAINIPSQGTVNFGTLTYNSTGSTSITTDSSVQVTGTNTANSLTLVSAGALTNAAATSQTITNNASFTGTSVTLANNATDTLSVGGNASFTATSGAISIPAAGTVNFGKLTFNSTGSTSITEDSATVLRGTSTADGLTLASAGSITDDNTANVTVTNNANFNANGGAAAITLNDTYSFGSLTFAGTAVTVVQTDAMTLSGTNTASSLVLSSGGALTDASAATLTVTGNASLTGTSIDLGNAGGGNTVNFGSLTFNSVGAVNVKESSDTVLSGTSTADSLTLTSTASITNDATADVTVANNANLSATSITLGNQGGDSINFGSLTFNSAGAVDIALDSGTSFSGTSTADSLALASTGAITNAASASLTVSNNASFNGTSIDLGNQSSDSMNFGSLTYNSGGAVSIAQNSAMVITGTNTADSLTLTSTGSITDVVGTSQTITNGASFSGTSITLADDASDVLSMGTNASFTASGGGAITVGAVPGGFTSGSLTFNTTGAVNIIEISNTVLSGTSTAGSLLLNSGGTITDDGTANVTVTNNASFIGTGITLANTYHFGTLTFNSSGAVDITEADATQITGSNTVDSLTLTSAGAITNASGTSIAVTNDASFSGTSVTLANNATDTLSVGGIASFTATAGAISIPAAGTVNFGSLTYNSTAATSITEDSATQLSGTSAADSLALVSAGAITNAAATSQTITNGASFSGTSITLANNATDTLSVGGNASFTASAGAISIPAAGTVNFGTLTFSSTGATAITEDSAMSLTGASSADGVTLTGSGATSDIVVGGTVNGGATGIQMTAGRDVTLNSAL